MKRRIIGLAAGLFVFTAVIFGALWIYGCYSAQESSPPAETDEKDNRILKKSRDKTPQKEKSKEEAYPEPTYDFRIDEITVEIEDLERDYQIAFVNDVHLITDHTSGDVTEDHLVTVRDRYENMAVTEEGIHSEELWEEIIKYLNYHDFDAVVLGGDILDYCSNSNINTLNDGIRELKYPRNKILYLRSDHDYGGWYGGNGFTDATGFILQSYVLDGDREEKCLDFGEFSLVGFNRSYKNISQLGLESIEERLKEDKPVILATHVPFYSETDDSLAECSMATRNKIYYWSEDSENYIPDERTQRLIDIMYAEDSNVVQIVAAHLHTMWDGNVTDHLKEHIFAPAFKGNIGIIHVTGGKKNEKEYETEQNIPADDSDNVDDRPGASIQD